MSHSTGLSGGTDVPEGLAEHALSSRRWIALVVVCLGQLMLTIDATIVNVALPAIQHELGFSLSALTWVPNAYFISLGSCLLLAGRLADLWGRKPMFLVGISVFTVASFACGIAPTSTALVVARFIQGIGAAISTSCILALIVVEFPDPRARGTAMSVYTLVSVAGASVGLLIGGSVTEALGWHWIFFINVPVGVIAIVLGYMTLDGTPPAAVRARIDWIGSVLITLSCLAAVTGIVRIENVGLGSWQTLGLLLVAIGLFGLLVPIESRTAAPIIPARILKIRALIATGWIRWLVMMGNYASFFLGVVYLERTRHYSPSQAGAAFLPQTLMVCVGSAGLVTWISRRFGLRRTLIVGLTLMTLGLAIFAAALREDASYLPWPALSLAVMGFGVAMVFITSTQIGLADVPANVAGIASGVMNMSQQLGAAAGVALLGTIAASRAVSLHSRGVPTGPALAAGDRLGLFVGVALELVALVIAITLLRNPRPTGMEAVPRPAGVEPI